MAIEIIHTDVLFLTGGSAFPRCSALRKTFLSAKCRPVGYLKPRAFSAESTPDSVVKLPEKPPGCTADELHYVTVPKSDWRLALWRYHPHSQAPVRNHPLLLLSGVGTNAIGYDLSPECSFARYMSREGFDTWVLEARGAGLSLEMSSVHDFQNSIDATSEEVETFASNGMKNFIIPTEEQSTMKYLLSDEKNPRDVSTFWDESKLVSSLTDLFMRLSERVSGFLSEGQLRIISVKLLDQISKLLEDTQLSEAFNDTGMKLLNLLESRRSSGITGQIVNLSENLVNIIEEGHRSVSPQLFDVQERLFSTIEDFQKQLDLIVKFNWDFDNYLEEDVPAAMDYIRAQTTPYDGRLLAIGHSMGGMLLYSMLSKCAHGGRDPKLAAVVTLAASLEYTSSESKLKLILPLADPAQALNVPVVPLGTLLAVAYPLSSRPPYVFSWLNHLISAKDMMHPDMLERLVMNNFCTIPAKLILQLTTAFKVGGLRDRSGTFLYKDHLHKCTIPVLALAGDHDLICPPEAVEDTVKLLPNHLVSYKVLGEPDGPHFAHYDLVGGKLAAEQVYPWIIQFLSQHDLT